MSPWLFCRRSPRRYETAPAHPGHERFKSGRNTILIATDVAARGIDVKGVDAVFNYDLPQDHEYYIHRIGRTGRAGKTGTAYNILSGRKQEMEMRDISRYTKADIAPRFLCRPPRNSGIGNGRDTHPAAGTGGTAVIGRGTGAGAGTAGTGIVSGTAAGGAGAETAGRSHQEPATFDVPKPIRKGKRAGAKTVRVHINAGRKDRMAPNLSWVRW